MSGEPASTASAASTAPSIATQAGGSNFNGTTGVGYSGYSGTVAIDNQTSLTALPNTNQPSINQLGDAAASNALQYLGVPYTWGGTSPQTGFDCSGLVQRVYQNLGVALPRTAAEQSNVGTPVSSISQAVPGDLIFYGSPADH
ncbi:MAG: C40 family peptidase, partial [Acidimicrobiaceae bacterium]|nr:C40 family peptidase [Acidimicrobiaceae bacterium]